MRRQPLIAIVAVLVAVAACAAGGWLALAPRSAQFVVPGARDVRVQGMAPGLRVITFRMADPAADWATQLQYPRTSEYSVVPAGTYDLEVKLADSGETVLTAPGVNLSGDTVNELVIMGNLNDEDHPLEIKVLSDTTGERNGDAGSSTPTS